MKFLWVVCVGSVLVATVCEAQEASTSQRTGANEATQGGSTDARSRAIGGTNQDGNAQTRFINPGAAVNALVGVGSSLLSGFLGGRPQRPVNFGSRPPSFGGRPPGFGGNRPQCFGNNCFSNQGFNQGFGNPGFGNQGFGNPGFGNQGFGNQGFGNQGFQPIGFGNQGFGFNGKRGRCPPVRSQCPRNFVQIQQPVQCQADFRCPGSEKCCRDACIPFPVCKPALF